MMRIILNQQWKEKVMKHTKKSKPAPRNVVAKYAQESGAGRHRDPKNDYRRQLKHRHHYLKTMED
jgi:hypothetical protein